MISNDFSCQNIISNEFSWINIISKESSGRNIISNNFSHQTNKNESDFAPWSQVHNVAAWQFALFGRYYRTKRTRQIITERSEIS